MGRADGEGPERTCIASRRVLPVERLIRFVAAPDGSVAPDLKRRLPGRGVWVEARAEAVAEAVRRKAFARTLKAKVTPSPTLAADVEALLERDALQALSLANKAGAVVCGAAKIEGGARKGYAALLHAAEASTSGVEKLERSVRRAREGAAPASLQLFSGAQLSLSLGREHVIHAALIAGGPAENVFGKVRALQDYRRSSSAAASAPEPMVPERDGMFVSTRDSDPDE
jgi:predicted RNA-binding protein YlxR (DUF448 family)